MLFAVGIVALAVVVVLLFGYVSPLSASLLLVGDSMAHAASWLGVTSPRVGWALLGVLGGGMAGGYIGMRRAGLAATPRKLGGVLAVLGAALLVAGSYAPESYRTTRSVKTERPTFAARPMWVANQRAVVRARPDAEAERLGVAPPYAQVTMLDLSADGEWAMVDYRGKRLIQGWVLRSRLASGAQRPPRSQPADELGSRDVAERSPAVDSGDRVRSEASGEVQLADSSATPSTSAAQGRGAVDSAGSVTPPQSPPPSSAPAPLPSTPDRETRPSGGFQPIRAGGYSTADPADGADPQAVAEVRDGLRTARASAGTGDFSAALRALAAADESIEIAAARVGELRWVADLRRQARAARSNVRTSCERVAAVAASRGEPAPRCE